MSDTNENCTYGYDYENKCDCREDDNCGCTFPNNMPHDFDSVSYTHLTLPTIA